MAERKGGSEHRPIQPHRQLNLCRCLANRFRGFTETEPYDEEWGPVHEHIWCAIRALGNASIDTAVHTFEAFLASDRDPVEHWEVFLHQARTAGAIEQLVGEDIADA